ncbi:uncharacterized protein QO010_001590 [Caulobacter ginsengisoli]|uniref:Mth938-like domain-containing protein n=1 Tax=Caulobacter ginsengisoli TaxID=400775 RepID=A0ABU0IPD1_9CAUL|nr:MTH938/NDUFAF3 family protein [Caulobacter ginsengisoli]MDQ0463819.1 uncharacterized protein [Caulobacter ginsengisoli]
MADLRQPPSIDAWGGGGFRVSGQWRPGSLLILNDEPLAWRPVSFDQVGAADLAEILAAGPAAVEFVLFGTGLTQMLPSRDLREAVKNAGLGLEFMSTQAAAQQYNVLASDGRRLAAALIAV